MKPPPPPPCDSSSPPPLKKIPEAEDDGVNPPPAITKVPPLMDISTKDRIFNQQKNKSNLVFRQEEEQTLKLN